MTKLTPFCICHLIWKENFRALQAEFRNEVALLTQIDHKNLVQLLGYINDANEQLIITEYVPNGTLREHLDGNMHTMCTHFYHYKVNL